ncbi:hypothetical protein JOD54_003693 [Actinokineospora baliensis]|uniref:hypothetical protein n=1 Tax=Actinokineospora baliensis TaxID=547056 RepID=UPI00195A1ED4|nr:hypothetical protein [Actinokineospora baliensis]MBM7773489.1 hypothetical protein [Actinokineospora baliensis]
MRFPAPAAVVIAAALALLPLPASADPVTELDHLAAQLTTPTEVDAVLDRLPPVLADLREITESQDALHVLANTQAFVATAGELPAPVVVAVLPSLLHLLSALLTPDLPLIPLLPLLPST